jgi:histidine phosphotransfer protein HptB
MMKQQSDVVVDWARFAHAKASLGHNFWRVLNYFREDGAKAVTAIEDALRSENAIGIIGPADLLKSESIQMGALLVAELAEEIEMEARDCVEWHQSPAALLETVIGLRVAFGQTVVQFDREASPLLARKPNVGPRTYVMNPV